MACENRFELTSRIIEWGCFRPWKKGFGEFYEQWAYYITGPGSILSYGVCQDQNPIVLNSFSANCVLRMVIWIGANVLVDDDGEMDQPLVRIVGTQAQATWTRAKKVGRVLGAGAAA